MENKLKSTKKYYDARVASGFISKTFWVQKDIFQKIRRRARLNGRSVTAEIQKTIEHYYSMITE